QFANNVYYDGVLGENEQDEAQDIISAFLFRAGGYNQRGSRIALDARKNGRRAVKKLQRDAIRVNADLLNDVSKLQELIQSIVDQVMVADHGDGEGIDQTDYRAIVRLVRDRLVVTGVRNGHLSV